jgi:ribonuclease HI
MPKNSKKNDIKIKTIKKSLKKSKNKKLSDKIIIYTDGACSNNHQKDLSKRKAGYGVFYGTNDKRNISERLKGVPTNNRAELQAIIVAMEQNKNNHIEIFTDSNYCKNIMTLWMNTWKKNGWRKKTNKKIENLDLIKKLDNLLTEMKYKPLFTWVKGHSSSIGNEGADKLAREGCYKDENEDQVLNNNNNEGCCKDENEDQGLNNNKGCCKDENEDQGLNNNNNCIKGYIFYI